MPAFPEQLRAYAFESITVNTTAVGCTSSKINQINSDGSRSQALSAYISCETATVRYTIDGTTVNASTNGHALTANQAILLTEPNDIKRFSAVRTGSTNGTLKVTYFGAGV